MSTNQRSRGIAVLLVFLAALNVGGCGHEAEHREASAPLQVRTGVVTATSAPRLLEAVGSLRAESEAVLSGKVMGSIVAIRKEAGDPIRRGEVLIVVDGRDVMGQVAQAQGALAQAKAAAALAETNLRRFEQLLSRGAASQLELDQARYQYETAKGAVQQAEGAVTTASSYTTYAEIAAPFDGRVVDRMCEVGDMAAPGRPLMKVEDARRIRLHVSLPESDFAAVATGASVAVEVPSLGARMIEGRIAEIVPAMDPATRTFLVKVALPDDPDLRSGLFARALFRGPARQAVRVPREAILSRGGLTGVFVVEGDRASFRLLTIADAPGDSVEVLSGLAEGTRMIIAPPPALEEGSLVEVRG